MSSQEKQTLLQNNDGQSDDLHQNTILPRERNKSREERHPKIINVARIDDESSDSINDRDNALRTQKNMKNYIFTDLQKQQLQKEKEVLKIPDHEILQKVREQQIALESESPNKISTEIARIIYKDQVIRDEPSQTRKQRKSQAVFQPQFYQSKTNKEPININNKPLVKKQKKQEQIITNIRPSIPYENYEFQDTYNQRQSLPAIDFHPQTENPSPTLKKQKTLLYDKMAEPENQAPIDSVQKEVENVILENEDANRQGKEYDQDFGFDWPTLRYGDIISISFNKTYKLDTKKPNDGKIINDIEHPSDLQQLKEKEKPNASGKTKQSKFNVYFKGVVYCNGVTDYALSVISKNFFNQPEPFTQFKNTLFKIETFSKYEVNQQVNKLIEYKKMIEADIQERKGQNNQSQNNDQSLQLQQNNSQQQQQFSLNNEDAINKIKENINNLQEALQIENLENEYLNKQMFGSKVQYGERVLLKHEESGMYLSLDLNSNEILEEIGCVPCKLQDLNENSLLTISPSDRLRQIGQIILYQDTFLIKNFIMPTVSKNTKYMHVNLTNLANDKYKAILQVNGSSDTSVFKARLFKPNTFETNQSKEQKKLVHSGEIIRFYHKEANGFLSVKIPNIVSKLPEFPDFVKQEIEDLIKLEKDTLLQEKLKKENGVKPNESAIKDAKQNDDQLSIEKPKQEVEYQVAIEIDNEQNNKAKYLWEVQKLKPFQVQQVQWDQYYRIKHVLTGLYLATIKGENKGEQDLVLLPIGSQENFLFKIIKDGQTTEISDQLSSVQDLNLLKIQCFGQRVMIQTQARKEKSFRIDSKMETLYQQKSIEDLECQIEKKENHAKMVFQIQIADAYQCQTVRQTYFQLQSGVEFYKHLNQFGVIEEPQDKNAIKAKDYGEIQKPKMLYNLENAQAYENELSTFAKNMKKNIIDLRLGLIYSEAGDMTKYKLMQDYLAEQGILEVYIKLLELIFYKCIPYEGRYKYSSNKKFVEIQRKKILDELEKKKVENEKKLQLGQGMSTIQQQSNNITLEQNISGFANQLQIEMDQVQTPYKVAEAILSEISAEILSTLYLMIKENKAVGEILSKYDNILFAEILGKHIKKADKVFEESYKLSRIRDVTGSFLNFSQMNEKLLQNFQNLGRWIDILDEIKYIDNEKQNLTQQILLLKVISLMCQDEEGNGIYSNQMLVYQKLINSKLNFQRIRFGFNEKLISTLNQEGLFIQFSIRKNEGNTNGLTHFLEHNPYLKSMVSASANLEHEFKGIYYTPPICFYQFMESNQIQSYLNYLLSYINVIISMIENGNVKGRDYSVEIGLDAKFSQSVFKILKEERKSAKEQHNSNKSNLLKNESKLQIILIKFQTAMYINNQADYGPYGFINRSYYWPQVHNNELYHKNFQRPQPFLWDGSVESNELVQKDKDVNRSEIYQNLALEVEKILLIEKFIVKNYDPSLNDWQLKDKKPLLKKLKLIITAFECALSLLKCEKIHPVMTQKIIYFCAIIFSRFLNNQEDQFHYHPFYKIIEESLNSQIQECKEKVNQLYALMLKALFIISKTRMDQQIMMALKSFKECKTNISEELGQKINQFNRSGTFKRSATQVMARIDQNTNSKLQNQIQDIQRILSNMFNFEYNGLDFIEKPLNEQNQYLKTQNDEENFNANEDQQVTSSGLLNLVPQSFFEEATVSPYLKSQRFNVKNQLLYLIFDKSLNLELRKLAFEVLVSNFEMVNSLKSELNKVKLITNDNLKEYSELQEERNRFIKKIQDVVWTSFITSDSSNKTECKRSVDDCIQSIQKFSQDLSFSNNRSRNKQNMLRNLEIHRLMIDCIIKDVKYNKEQHQQLFQEIMKFLFAFSFKNEENCKSLTSQLDFLTSLKEIDISNEMLITQIVKQLKVQNQESQLIEHFMTELSNSNNWRKYANLLKALTSLAENSKQNKSNIFKKIVKSQVFDFLYINMNSRKEIYMAKRYQLVIKNSKESTIWKDKDEYDKNEQEYLIHKSLIALLWQCSNEQLSAIPQMKKKIKLKPLCDVIFSRSTSILLKKKYLRLLLILYYYKDQKNQPPTQQELSFKELFDLVIYEDLREFPNYLSGLLKKTTTLTGQLKDAEEHIKIVQKEELDYIKSQFETIDKQRRIKKKTFIPQNKDPTYIINEKDPSEYWRYMSNFSNTMNDHDGLLHFIIDFLLNNQGHLSFEKMTWVFSNVKDLLERMNKVINVLNSKFPDVIEDIDIYSGNLNQAISLLDQVIQNKIQNKERYQNQNGLNLDFGILNDFIPKSNGNSNKFTPGQPGFNKQATKSNFSKGKTQKSKKTPTSKMGDNSSNAKQGNFQVHPVNDGPQNQNYQTQHSQTKSVNFDAVDGHNISIYNHDEKRTILTPSQIVMNLEDFKTIKIVFDLIFKKMTDEKKPLPLLFNIENYDEDTELNHSSFTQAIRQISAASLYNDQVEIFYRYILEMINKYHQKQEEVDSQRKSRTSISYVKKPVNIFSFVKVCQRFLNDAINQYNDQQKATLNQLLTSSMTKSSNTQEDTQEQFSQFVKIVFDQSKQLNPKTNIQEIIGVIIASFDFSVTGLGTISDFFSNLIANLQYKEQRIYILRVIRGILFKYQKKTFLTDKTIEEIQENRDNFNELLNIMKECKLAECLLRYLDKDEEDEVSMISIKILNLLLNGIGKEVQEQLYQFIKENLQELRLTEHLKIKIENLTPQIIQEKFNQIINVNLQQAKESPSENPGNQPIKREVEPEEDDEQRKRSKTIKQLIGVLRFVQYLCDSCHQGFQNFFRDQLQIQSEDFANQYSQEKIEKTSTFNIVITVGQCFMKLTDTFQELIFHDAKFYSQNKQDEGLAGLMSQFFELLIDFLYGPCNENQKLLSNWALLMRSLEFYFKSEDLYFFAQDYQQECRFKLMSKASQLLLALIENPSKELNAEFCKNIEQGMSFDVLQTVIIEIHKHKIFGYQDSLKIFKSKKRYRVQKEQSIEEKIYPQESLRDSDEEIFSIGFNLYIFLSTCKRFDPEIPQLKNTDHLFKEKKIKILKKEYENRVEKKISYQYRRLLEQRELSAFSLNFIQSHQTFLLSQKDEEHSRDVTEHKIVFEYLEKIKNQYDEQEVDVYIQSRLQKAVNNIWNGIQKCCKPRKQQKRNNNPDKQAQSIEEEKGNSKNGSDSQTLDYANNSQRALVQQNQSLSIQEENPMNVKNQSQLAIKDDNQSNVKAQVEDQEDDNEEGQEVQNQENSTQPFTEEDIQDFQLRLACQFYSQFVAQIELDYKGTTMRTMFRIQQRCVFLSKKTRQWVIYDQDTTSLIDKLEDLFSKINVILAEMKSNQKLARGGKIRLWLTNQTSFFQLFSSFLIISINILLLIFYAYSTELQKVAYTQSEASTTVLIMAICNAFISMLIHLGYFIRFHGVYNEWYKQWERLEKKEQFTEFKGSLGYADSLAVKRQANNIVVSDAAELKEQQSCKKFWRNLKYAISVYFIGFSDPRHTFHFLYFLLSVGSAYFPLMFGFLLLEIVIQIPLLYNVVQAIIQNRKQILYTLLLLLVIIYIYAFIAFITFRETYINSGNSEDATLNGYCDTLGFCFSTTLNNGIRSGGGIGDQLEQLDPDSGSYWGRYFFDLSFYIIILILLLNLIFGIIIDAFAEMRDKRKLIEEEVQEKCFICGNSRAEFETRKLSFLDHIMREHNVFAYIYYILYLSNKPKNECTGVEKYVQSLIETQDASFFPIEQSLSIEEIDQRISEEKAVALTA